MGQQGFSEERALAHAKIRILKHMSRGTLGAVRADLPINAYASFISWLCSDLNVMQKCLSNPFPQTRGEWRADWDGPSPIGIAREIRWCSEYLFNHSAKINEFVRLRNDLDSGFLLSERDHTFELIDEIKNRIGLSYWLIKKRIALHQHFDGLEAQKKYSSKIKNSEPDDSIVRYIAHYSSVRAEPTGSAARFQKQYRSQISGEGLPEGHQAYLRHHVISDMASERLFPEILRLECGSAAIDQYETFIAVARMIIATNCPETLRILTNALKRLQPVITDPRLAKLLIDIDANHTATNPPVKDELEQYRLFRRGEYEVAYKASDEYLSTNPRSPCSLYISALSLACLADSTHSSHFTYQAIVENLKEVIIDGANAEENCSALMRTAWALEGSPIASMIRGVIDFESHCAPRPTTAIWNQHLLPAIDDLHPIQLRWSTEFAGMGSKTTRCPHDQYRSEACPSEKLWIQMSDAILNKDYQLGLILARELAQVSEHPYYRRGSIRTLSHCLLRLGKYFDAVTLVVDYYLSDQKTADLLPIQELTAAISPAVRRELAPHLSYAILCELNSRISGPQTQHLVRHAYEDYLQVGGATRPSQLTPIDTGPERRKRIFFLREICVESIMDASIAFDSSADVAKERIEICKYLAKVDSDRASKYNFEIQEIERRINTKEHQREIEQSRIRIDLESIRLAARKALEDDFARYKTYLSAPSAEQEAAVEASERKILHGDISAIMQLSVPQNERTALLETMFTVARDEFVSSNEHGLDGNLSVGIRHSTFEGQLRSPLESASLLTRRDSKSKIYKLNMVWGQKLGLIDSKGEKAFLNAFQKFSAGYDSLIESILGEWFQVKKARDAKGLFDFSIIGPEVHIMYQSLHAESVLDDFIEPAMNFFMQRLDVNLKRVREELQNSAKPRMLELLANLQSDLKPCESYSDIAPLMSAISSAQTNLLVTIDRITEWFRVAQAEKKIPFLVEMPISRSTQNIRSISPGFRVNLELGDELKRVAIVGSAFSFIDLLDIAFSNATKHSGITPANVKVYATLEEGKVAVRIVNPVADGIATDSNKLCLEAILAKVRATPFSKSAAEEGGSGFYKMQKILHRDFRDSATGEFIDSQLSFGFIGDDHFYVEFKVASTPEDPEIAK